MWAKIQLFLSNGGYATWVQTAVALLTVLVAYLALRDTDIIQGKQTTLELARKYYSADPTPALAMLRLENAQLDVVNKARASLPAYDPKADADQEILLKTARPMLKARIDGDKGLQTDYETMRDVYYEVATCMDTKACDGEFAGTMFGPLFLRFYNAACPYIEEVSSELNHAHDNDNMLKFLQIWAKFTDKKLYFCR